MRSQERRYRLSLPSYDVEGSCSLPHLRAYRRRPLGCICQLLFRVFARSCCCSRVIITPDRGRRGGKRIATLRLILVASTTMSAACLSGVILGSFMCTLIVLCGKLNRDPGKFAPCLLCTLYIRTKTTPKLTSHHSSPPA